MKVKHTCRGFELIEFKDVYGFACSLQESSADGPHIWLGCDDNCFHQATKEPMSPRMHLNRRQVKALVKHLNNWLETRSFKSPRKAKK